MRIAFHESQQVTIRASSGISSPRQAVRVAAAVPALVVGAHDQPDVVHEAPDPVEHLLALEGVGLDQLPLVGVELAGLVDDRLGDRDLADVVQERAEFEVPPLLAVQFSSSATARARPSTPRQWTPV